MEFGQVENVGSLLYFVWFKTGTFEGSRQTDIDPDDWCRRKVWIVSIAGGISTDA